MKKNNVLIIVGIIAVLVIINFYSKNFMAVLSPGVEKQIDFVGGVSQKFSFPLTKSFYPTKFDVTIHPIITELSDPKSVSVDVGLEGVDFVISHNETVSALNESRIFMEQCNTTVCELPVTLTSSGLGSANVLIDIEGGIQTRIAQEAVEKALLRPQVGWAGILFIGTLLLIVFFASIKKKPV